VDEVEIDLEEVEVGVNTRFLWECKFQFENLGLIGLLRCTLLLMLYVYEHVVD
jgi:hypothetical protein